MKKLKIIAIALFAFATSQLYAQNTSTGGEFGGLKNTVKQYHVTANTTINVATQTARLYGLVVNSTNAGTTWTITVAGVSAGNQGTIPIAIGPVTITLGNPAIPAIPQPGINLNGGINVTFTGTPGVADIWVEYR
jgi:hypothetical protein